jgi:hypothetical protein
MAGRSEEVFPLDFLFIEQTREPERAKQVSHVTISTSRGPADAGDCVKTL